MKNNLKLMVILTALVSLWFLTTAAVSPVPETEVPVASDLSAIAKQASSKGLPILIVFSAEHCPYCELLEAEIIKPMILSGDYKDQVLIYKIMTDDSRDLRDFDGGSINADILTQRYGVYVTPTMLFVDGRGQELSERILGINTVEMFGGLVDQAIDTAKQRLAGTDKQLVKNSRP